MMAPVNQLVSWCFHQLSRIKSCHRTLLTEAAKTLLNSFVVTRVDLCNCLLAGSSMSAVDKLQRVFNAAMKVMYEEQKYNHITSLLHDNLHWLKVPEQKKKMLTVG